MRKIPLLMLAVVVGVAPFLLAAEPSSVKPADEVTPQEEIRFEQDKAAAHMTELEQRMFKLANLIRDAQPEDAARLLMGLEKAREHLIADRMREASQLLATLKLDRADHEQEEIIERLEELKRMLLSADIELELKLEQLRKLREARSKLAELTKKEQRQFDNTKTAEAPDFKPLEENENRNKRLGEDLAESLKRFGPGAATATGAVGGATKSMASAASNLNKQNSESANKNQKDALDKLAKADANLKELEESLQKELEAFVQRRVMEIISDMIAQQRQIRESTEDRSPRATDGNTQAVAAVRGLSEPEEELIPMAQHCIELCDLVQFSMVLPLAMEAVSDQIASVAVELGQGKADAPVIAAEKQIETDLEALLNALKESARRSAGGAGQCSGCQGNRNKLLAEVKMLRWMEFSLHQQTVRLDDQIRSGDLTQTDGTTKITPLLQRQRDIQAMTLKLHDATCPDCLGGI